jgi:cobalt-zinc-cadmium resistance protein CzcA
MVRKLIEFALNNPLVIILLAIASAVVGIYSFINVNVEAYPDPAPAIVEVYAQFPGASAEEVERQVTIPLEVTFAGMPGLKFIHSKSLFGLSDLKMNWHYGPWTYETARQEVINRIATISQPLPANVSPTISPESPTGEIYRYVLKVPKDPSGREIYTLNDIKAMQDWVMERDFRAVPRIVDLTSYGGTVRRYEVQPDPDRLRRYGITLPQLQTALANSNATVGGDYVDQGQLALTVRSVGLFGGGKDPVNKVLGFGNRETAAYLAEQHFTAEQRHRILEGLAERQVDPPLTPEERRHVETINRRAALGAASILRAEEYRRISDIRSLVIASVNNQPVRVEDVVEGGRISLGQLGEQGVVVSNQTRLGRVGYWKADRERPPGSTLTLADVGHDADDVVECIVLMRKNEDTLPALRDVKQKVEEVNDPASGRELPGVKIEPYYDRTDLIHVTTETVTENLVIGVLLVITVLFMFVNNIRTAIIVAINIPLALLFAFSMLYLRGKSANLLSIGAVDFGIIVDSSVIMVENIYRNLASGNYPSLPIKERILRFVKEIDNALLFSVLIMVCAFVPLFTMSGAEGALFAPMAQTYAFSLAGALVLALTLTPVLCMLLFKNFKPVRENLLVRGLKSRYLWNLKLCLKYRWTLLTIMAILFLGTACLIPHIGREFMPELEEGNLWIRSTGPLNQSLDRNIEIARQARMIIAFYPEVEAIVTQSGRPDDGTDIEGYENTEFFVPMRPRQDRPRLVDQTGWGSWLWGPKRQRTKVEVVDAMDAELRRKIPGINWNFSQNIRDNVMEALSGFKGDNSLKIFGPEVEQLELLAEKVKNVLQEVPGMEDVGVIHEMGQSHLEFRVDPAKCEKWGVMTADVNNVVSSALGARAMSSMVEGEKLFDISIRWPKRLRNNEASILDIPVDIINNQVVLNQYPGTGSGAVAVPSAKGFAHPDPAVSGTLANTANPMAQQAPRLRLRDLVSPVAEDGSPDPSGQFERAGAAAIFREQGKRLIAIKFGVRGRDLGSVVDDANARIKELIQPSYRAVWAGEIEQMQDANHRLLWIIPLSLGMIFILLYAAFRSFLDAIVILSNVLDVAVGGIWALYLTGTTFSVSAAVGFVSLFGIAIMEGLLLISYFNVLRIQGLPLHDAIIQGALKRVRPVMITAMTAILGLLPAALSTKIGAQTARPLAIVVVGGMAVTLLLDRYLMPVLYTFYGNRQPPEGAANLAH